jgi:GDPmannose 4,6-dehydratase
MPRALITGSGGQDGVYLTRLLHAKGYTVSGIDLGGQYGEVDGGYTADVTNRGAIRDIVAESQPDEVYFLAAFHHSSEGPQLAEEEALAASFDVNTLALNQVLGALADLRPAARLLYASSSRTFGEPASLPQNEDTPSQPVEPYGISKAAGMQIIRYWRRVRGLFAVSAILYNHESPLRPPHFLSQKVVQAAVKAAQGLRVELRLGNPSAQADWGHAADTVRAMWLMLQRPDPADYVVATGVLHTVRDWLDDAFGMLSLDWRVSVVEDQSLLNRGRPAAVLCGDSTRLRRATGWRPEFTFQALVRDMVRTELARHGAGHLLQPVGSTQ